MVTLEVDRINRRVLQRDAWTTGLFAAVMGDADRIANNRMLVTHGQLFVDEQGNLANRGLGERGARIQEVDRDTHEVLWQLEITSDAATSAAGWSVPRAERLY